MAIPTRTIMFGMVIGACLLVALGYFFLNSYEQKGPTVNSEIVFANGTKILVKDDKQSGQGGEKDHWHDKMKDQLQATTNLGFLHAFIASISVIVVSELGDKTFFIAAIMAMRHSRLIIYTGAMGALGAMTILSALLGNIVTKFVPRIYTYYLSSILFAGFGVKMLKDGYHMSPDEGAEEYKEVQQEVEQAEAAEDLEGGGGGDLRSGSSTERQSQHPSTTTSKQKGAVAQLIVMIRRYVPPILIQAFILTFLAEWGDRSQITTIVLAASENLPGVIIGGTIGHGLCTGLAVIGGRFVAQRISPKTVTLVGGVVFLCFALSAFFIRPDA